MSFVDIPLDLLMEISRELDLPDSLHLIATCTTLTSILHSRYFWIAALDRMEKFHRKPPLCSPGLDILTLPLPTLKELAIHAYKLKKNWSSEAPSPVSVQTIEIDDSPSRLVAIQGTRLIITVSSSRLACWDTSFAECVGTFTHMAEALGMEAGNSLELYPLLRPESCSIGMVYSSPSTNALELAIICFEHRNSSAVKVLKVFSKIWTPPEPEQYSVSEVIVNESTIAAILVKHCRRDRPRCIILEDDFYVTRQYFEPSIAEIIHVQTSAIQIQTQTLDLPIHKTTIPVPSSTTSPITSSSLGFCNLRLPTYGVLNITLKAAYADDDGSELFLNSLHFWPAEHDGLRLAAGSLCFYEHPCHIESVAVGSSATCGIIVDEQKALGLVQYLPHQMPEIQFMPLDVPDLGVPHHWEEGHMELDDRLGVFYLGRFVPETGRYYLSVVSIKRFSSS
ncbi:hypothetical protein B0H19DRAFT_1374290 [Mycena capillaripes]|nr:hypothetical protein B0H19DRAFT_1374290 [Mycena capillaripes]